MKRTQRVAIVVPWLQGGGAQVALEGILEQLPQEALDLFIVFDNNRNHERIGRLVRETHFLGHSKSPLGVLRAGLELPRVLGEYSSIYSLMRASHMVLGVRPSFLERKRFAASFHQLPSEDSRSPFAAIENWLVRRATRQAQLVTAPAVRAVEELRDGHYANPKIICLDPNLMPSLSSDGIARAEQSDVVKLLAVGRLSAQKGLDRLPSLLSAADRQVELHIVGEGEQRSALENLEWPRHVNARLLGHVSNVSEKIDWCDALVMPSRAELNPVAIWEAWSRGRPVLTSDLGVFRDLAEQGPLRVIDSSRAMREQLLPDSLAELQDHAFQIGPQAAAKRSMHSHVVDFVRSASE